MGLQYRQEQSTHKSIWPNVWHVTVSNNETYILTNHDYPKLLISEFRESTKSNIIFFQIRRDAPKLQSKFIGNVPVSLIRISPRLNSLAQHTLSLDEHPPSWKSGQILMQARTRNVFLLGFWKLAPDITEAEMEDRSMWNPHMPLAGLPEQPGSSFDLTWAAYPLLEPSGHPSSLFPWARADLTCLYVKHRPMICAYTQSCYLERVPTTLLMVSRALALPFQKG